MSEVSEKPEILEDYPLHLPDKPFPIGKISYQDFLDWMDEDTHAEWVDGEIELMPSPASYKHQNIKGFLETVFRIYVEVFDLGTVVSAGLQMKLNSRPRKRGSGREPDVLFVAKANLGRMQDTYLDGPADLAVEIVSPESIERDKVTKFGEYARGGVPEYWLIEPDEQKATFYQLDPISKQYLAIPLDSEGRYYSAVIKDFWLKPEWLWQNPLPKADELLLEVGGETYIRYFLAKVQKRGFLPSK